MRWLHLFHRDRYEVRIITELTCLIISIVYSGQDHQASSSKQASTIKSMDPSSITSQHHQASTIKSIQASPISTIKQAPSHCWHQKSPSLCNHSPPQSYTHTPHHTRIHTKKKQPINPLGSHYLGKKLHQLTTTDTGCKKMQVKTIIIMQPF